MVSSPWREQALGYWNKFQNKSNERINILRTQAAITGRPKHNYKCGAGDTPLISVYSPKVFGTLFTITSTRAHKKKKKIYLSR